MVVVLVSWSVVLGAEKGAQLELVTAAGCVVLVEADAALLWHP